MLLRRTLIATNLYAATWQPVATCCNVVRPWLQHMRQHGCNRLRPAYSVIAVTAVLCRCGGTRRAHVLSVILAQGRCAALYIDGCTAAQHVVRRTVRCALQRRRSHWRAAAAALPANVTAAVRACEQESTLGSNQPRAHPPVQRSRLRSAE